MSSARPSPFCSPGGFKLEVVNATLAERLKKHEESKFHRMGVETSKCGCTSRAMTLLTNGGSKEEQAALNRALRLAYANGKFGN